MRVFYFFVKTSIDNVVRDTPICSDEFLGDIGDFVEIDGVGYIITDYAEEYWAEAEGDSLYW